MLNEICQVAEEEAVDAVLIAGDLFDTFNPPNEASELFYRTVHRLSAHGSRAVVAIAGNHDSPDRIEAPDPLARMSGVILVGRSTTVVPSFATEAGVEQRRSVPGFVELSLPGCSYPLRLILTPYANEVTLRRYLGDENREQSLRDVLRGNWRRLAEEYFDNQGVNILMAHLYFMQRDGPAPEEPDDEKPILHLGGASAILTEDLPSEAQYVALGHLHRHQVVAEQPAPVCYSSSPLAYSFSEVHQQKQVVIVEAEPDQRVRVRPVSLQAGRTLHRKRFESTDEALVWLQDHPYTFVELTLVSDSYLESKVKRTLYEAHDGIVSIIPELTKDTGEAAEARIDLSKDLRSLFTDYFRQRRGQEPNTELMALLEEVIGADDS